MHLICGDVAIVVVVPVVRNSGIIPSRHRRLVLTTITDASVSVHSRCGIPFRIHFGYISGSPLDPPWDHFGIPFGPTLGPFGGPSWIHFGIASGPLLDPVWGYFGDRFGTTFGPLRAPFRDHFGTTFGTPSGPTLGPLSGPDLAPF